jgi:hypothetical protein
VPDHPYFLHGEPRYTQSCLLSLVPEQGGRSSVDDP